MLLNAAAELCAFLRDRHQAGCGNSRKFSMIGHTISHYPALRDPEQRDKILEKSRPVPIIGTGRGCSFRSSSGTALGEARPNDLTEEWYE